MSVSEARYWWDSHLQSVQSIARRPVSAAYNAMVEECTKGQLAEMVLDLMHEKREMAKAHDGAAQAERQSGHPGSLVEACCA